MCSELTEARVEKGSPTVAIGIYLRILYALQLEDDILFIAKEDKLGKELQDIAMINRERASKKVAKRLGTQERDINLFSQRFITE
jgi:hypothetical protein